MQNLFAHRARRACQLRGLAAELFDHHHELVAAQARHGVDAAHAAAQALCHVLQQQVAHVMAQGVVQGLEVVQVDEQQRTALALALGAGQCLLHAVHQQHAVGQAGERVVEGQALHLALAGLARADVGVDLQDRRRLSVLARNPRPVCFHVERIAVAVVLGDLAHPLALLQCGVRGAREHCGVVVQQRLRALAQRLQPGPAVEALGALVPEQDAVRQVAHDDGVLRLVQQRGLVADARLGLLALDLGGGARGEDLQHRGDEPSLVQRFAEQHEDQAQRLAVGVAQLLADVALGAEFAQHGRVGVAPGHVALHHVLALRQQLRAGRAVEQVVAVGLEGAVDAQRQRHHTRGLLRRRGQQPCHAARLRAQRIGHVVQQALEERGAGAGRHGARHLEGEGLHALLGLARAQQRQAVREVVRRLAQPCLLPGVLRTVFGGVQAQRAKRFAAAIVQWQHQCARGIWRGKAAAHGASLGYGTRCTFVRQGGPCQLAATLAHGPVANGLQDLRLAAATHQGLVADRQQAQGHGICGAGGAIHAASGH